MHKWFPVTLLLWLAYSGDCSGAAQAGPRTQQCSNDFWCLDVEQKIDSLFSKLFFTEEQIKQLDNQWKEKHQAFRPVDYLRTEKNVPKDHDYDHCCPTRLVHMLNTTLVNVSGEEKVLIHLTSRKPPRYQLIPHGTCSHGPGSCTNRCHQEKQAFFLLVADFSNMLAPFTFDQFELPTYCSCKSV